MPASSPRERPSSNGRIYYTDIFSTKHSNHHCDDHDLHRLGAALGAGVFLPAWYVRIQFWGTRGSIAKPGPSTARYGGNTSCIEVRSARGTLVIIDCGTGAHSLGQKLMSGGANDLRGHILISHTHWDHIQGIPFFYPLFVPGNEWDIYGPKGLGQILA